MKSYYTLVFYCFLLRSEMTLCHLYPYETETREVKSLNGLWNFKISPEKNMTAGFIEKWYLHDFSQLGDIIKMPVPSSFNDITTNTTIRDYIGWVWYQRVVWIPESWSDDDSKIFLYFGSIHYYAIIYMNEVKIGEHEGGHLPFQVEVPRNAAGHFNFLTIAVNNTLTPFTVPQGQLYYPNDSNRYPEGYKLYSHAFDYFDYAGINRPVYIYTTHQIYVKDIHVTTDIERNVGIIRYSVKTSVPVDTCDVTLYDMHDCKVGRSDLCRGELRVPEAKLWWPAGTCGRDPGYLYIFEVRLVQKDLPSNATLHMVDAYRMPVGIRTVSWTNTSLLVNNEPVYLSGFGMHEDANIRGRGFDYAVMTRDMNLISWLGANAFRTSHYPYAEETIQEADALGLMVILEAPACSLSGFDEKLFSHHQDYIREMVAVYHNHPSVIMWSLANEPVTNSAKADYYFGNLSVVARRLDSTRPITFVGSQLVQNETAIHHMDVVCVNRYRGWYSDSGHTDLIAYQVQREMTEWHDKYDRPVIVTEYGAGAVAGLHTLPETMWSEDYQVVTHQQHFVAFDTLRSEGKIAGEMMWNFIDFNTPQEYIRPGRCSKGLFTRERQPKHVAHTVRDRYQTLGKCSE